jgi:hypothetical protein
MRIRLAIATSRKALPMFFVLIMIAAWGIGLLPSAGAVAQGDGTILYGEGTVTTPRTRTWTQSSTAWGAEGSGATAGATIRHVVTKASPKKDEIIAGIQTTAGTLFIQRWNGTSWSSEWSVTVGDGNLPHFDIAYEKNSGEALVVYGGNVATTNELRYRVWNGSSWTGESNLDAVRTTGTVQGVRLKAQVGTLNNDIGLVWGDSNLDLSATYWDGSSNTWAAEPSAVLSSNLAVVGSVTSLTNFCFDVALESTTGDMLVAWGNNTIQDLQYITRGGGAAGAWGTVTTNTAALEEPTDFDLVSEPNSDYIAYANISDNTTGADASTWTGSAWNSFNNFDTTSGTVAAGTKNIALSWLRSGVQDRAVVAYEDAATSTGVDWVFYNKNTNAWSATQTDFTTAPAAATNVTLQEMTTNPFNTAQAMLINIDSASDVFAKRLTFDGTNFTWSSSEPGGVALETTGSSATGFAADFTYSHFVPGPLTVDIVDSGGASVASPGVAMNAANVLLTCQSISGTFGTASQKVRVNNASVTPAWTLTLAATSGNTALWSGSSGQYDFNDSGGAPAGCSDGGDADIQAGRLTLNPASATVTPQSGCNTTGVSLGGSAAFAQATLDSLTLASASSSALNGCYWDITGIGASQQLPAEKGADSYTLNLTLTVTAN